ncbi:glycosyl hydrolase [Daphnia sinensis]|uniref:beta-N-acetylhexosaminidase n=1 Tax=Daphnia sinensis TaxID=1820382 RepID=A0AAD5PLL9_9CRUS|nr:glycosyl hydrolase [Daphnia sinensis]
MRIEQTPQYPFAITLGAMQSNSEKWVEEVGYRMGLDMKKAGVHLNLAPCADVNTNPDNPVIGYRSFGSDTAQVSKLALSAYKGMKKAGIGASELKAEELVPFQFGIDRGIEMIMVGHLAVPALTGGKEIAASISRELITDLLKGEMGFKGLVISDALNMKAVAKLFPIPGQLEWEAFRAGNDILCFSDHVPEGIQWISEHISDEEATLAFEKIQDLKRKLGVFDFQKLQVPHFDWAEHSNLQSKLAKEYIKVLRGQIEPASLEELARNGKLAHQVFFADEKTVFEHALDQKWGTRLSDYSVESAQKLIISVFVPSHKPLNQFGMDADSLTEIKELAKNKACILVHFGNPLALKHLGDLSDFEAVICAYQRFEEVQKIVPDLL